MRKNNRKGFTIIELVIVIAVLGILTGILIPTFAGAANNAKRAVDETLITNMNRLIAVNKMEGEPLYCLDDVFDNIEGYKPSDFKATVDGDEILYDSEEKEFILNRSHEVLDNPHRYFKIYDELPDLDDQVYSIYLNNTTFAEVVNVKVGFDCGNNTLIPEVNYSNSSGPQSVIIHTVNSDVNIDAAEDKVYHYGTSDEVIITAVDDSSYYAYSNSKLVSILEGRVVVEPRVKIENLHVKGNNVTISSVEERELPFVTREDGVSSIEVQTSNERGDVRDTSNVSIVDSTVTVEGDVDTDITDPLKNSLVTSKSEWDIRMAYKYDVCVGAPTSANEDDYYENLTDALEAFKGAAKSTYVNFYLLRDVTITTSYSFVCANAAYYSIYFQGHTITGEGCTPIQFKTIKALFQLIGPGKIVAENTSTYAVYVYSKYEVRLNNIDTVGKFYCKYSTSRITINAGIHTSCTFTSTGAYRIDSYDFTENVERLTTFDYNISKKISKYRNKYTKSGTIYTVTRLSREEQGAKGYNKIENTTDDYTRYDTFDSFVKDAEFGTATGKLLVDINESLSVTTAKSITLNLNGHNYTGSLDDLAAGTITLSNGTANIPYVNCSALSIKAGVTATIDEVVTVKTFAVSGASSDITIGTATIGTTSTVSGASSKVTLGTISVGTSFAVSGASAEVIIDDGTIGTTFAISSTSAKVTLKDGTYNGLVSVYGRNASLTIEGGTFVTGLISYGNKSSLTIGGGTFNGYIKCGSTSSSYKTYTSIIVINDGTFNCAFTKVTSTKHSITVNGGTYLNQEIYDTYKAYLGKNHQASDGEGGTIVVS